MSIEALKTITADRPDLEALEVNAPEGYIGNLVYPTVTMYEPGGEFSYAIVQADTDAEQARTAGDSITRAYLATATAEYTARSQESGKAIDWRQVKLHGGVERSDAIGGKAAKRSVMKKQETDQATALLTGTPVDITATPIANIMRALPSIKRYDGETAMVLSYSAWRWFIQQKEVLDNLKKFGWSGPSAAAVLSVQKGVVIEMLQNVYGVTQVLVGDDEMWETVDGRMALVKLPPQDEMSHVEGPVLGKTLRYLPDPAGNPQGIVINSWVDNDKRSNVYDAMAHYNVVELTENTSAKVLFSGLVPDLS